MQGRARRPLPVIKPWKNVWRRPNWRRSTKHLGRAFIAAPPRALDPHAIVGPKNITGGLLELRKLYACYTFCMTKRLEEVVADVARAPRRRAGSGGGGAVDVLAGVAGRHVAGGVINRRPTKKESPNRTEGAHEMIMRKPFVAFYGDPHKRLSEHGVSDSNAYACGKEKGAAQGGAGRPRGAPTGD
jgi:hypothetical protein